jgi:hypothetical protein
VLAEQALEPVHPVLREGVKGQADVQRLAPRGRLRSPCRCQAGTSTHRAARSDAGRPPSPHRSDRERRRVRAARTVRGARLSIEGPKSLDAQEGVPNLLVVAEFRGGTAADDGASIENVGELGDGEHGGNVLLHYENGYAALGAEGRDGGHHN